ncbi:putative XoxJ- and MxaJ-like protein precursor; Extracellular solute-binding protein [Methylocella tundrae]|uniref:Putative XoxJ- and MxaJ-like protein Extracellular solute-binding protein n=1 Tax=Methylocella tundrae TaxID=227605 RepID=A0A8B6MAY4_METTU|nr:substrate-binding domain-containing protein [Methylocella tundrae]VTZ28398.1 utative XoxJ- and MxaJ-like protein precursor; Extracellular solute-binding protein [Methylocella tundrae]VTZ52150.1 putative XoxJ- and MxaJ-like protein precursor; Extracellular solute-binding protein [Methylocella tundrae]
MSGIGKMKRIWPLVLSIAFLAPLGSRFAALAEGAADAAIELVDPDVLRVCADPRDLPFSNEAGEGFENKIAALLAQKLGKSLAYVYYPNSTGFIRNTLNAHRCDVVMEMPQGNDFVQVTNPYYRASYAMVTKKGGDLDGVVTLEDPRLKGKHIGIVAGTPPATNLAVDGLLPGIKSYPLVIDTRADAPTADMMKDLEDGVIDVAILWGPIAGNLAKTSKASVTVTPLVNEKIGPRMIYRIGMGVRHSDQEWKRTLNKLIAENQGEIDKILQDYGVPLLDENDKPRVN